MEAHYCKGLIVYVLPPAHGATEAVEIEPGTHHPHLAAMTAMNMSAACYILGMPMQVAMDRLPTQHECECCMGEGGGGLA